MYFSIKLFKEITFNSYLNPEEFKDRLSKYVHPPTKKWNFQEPYKGVMDGNSFVLERLESRVWYIIEGTISEDFRGSIVKLRIKFHRFANFMFNTVIGIFLITFILITVTAIENKTNISLEDLTIFIVAALATIIFRLNLERVCNWTLSFFNNNLKE